jgi:DNA-binding SARP family transcriptional activator/predicted ATPase
VNQNLAERTVSENIPTLHIRLLGEFGLNYGNQLVQSVGTLRLQSLLAWLVLHRSAPQSRRHLAFTLWPDSTESQALTNLRRELHNLRHALPAADRFLSVETQTLQWRPDAPFTLDVADFEQAMASAQQAAAAANESGRRDALAKALALYKGDLLPGCYDEWLLTERGRLRQIYLQTLAQLIALLQKQRDYDAAIAYAQQWLREDPLAEEAYLYLIRLYALTDDRARALRVYHSCVTNLQRELEVEPGPATRRAYEQLLQGDGPQQAQPAPQPALVGIFPLVGRQAEWQRLQSCWHKAATGHAQFVAVTGEAGIGKTRLVEELVAWAARQGITTAQARCYASEEGLAYAPVTDWLRTAELRSELLHLDDVWLTQVARLLPELLAERPDLPRPEPITESWQRQHFFEALARSIFVNDQPRLLVIDDLQWTDQETLAWLHYLLRHTQRPGLLVAATIRSTAPDVGHPLAAWLRDLRGADQLTEIELGPLAEPDTAVLAAHIAGTELDSNSAAQLYQETEGHPLFIVEMVRTGQVTAGIKVKQSLSPKIQLVIHSRLDQLSPPARRIANLAAAMGRAFTFEVLAAASQEDEDWLVKGLDELWHFRLIREQSDHEYDFSHNKIREVVYNSLSATNRRLLHRRIARAMEAVHVANLDSVSQQVARQYEAAGEKEKAIAYYQRAGQVAQQIYANADAIQLYANGLTLLAALPDTVERAEQELTVQCQLAIAHRNSKGYAAAEIGQALHRARALCEQLDRADALGPILWGLFTFHFVRADLRQAHRLGQELFSLGQEQQNPALLQQAHYALGGTLCSRGEFETSLVHFEQGIALYDVSQHHAQVSLFGVDLGVFCHAWSAHSLWHLGYLHQARQRSETAVTLAKTSGHPFSRALAMAYAAMLFQFSRNGKLVQEWAAATVDFCVQHDIGYYDNWAAILHGWALADQGALTEGIARMQQGLADFRGSHSEIRLPYYLTLLAEAYGNAGQVQEGVNRLTEALEFAKKNDDEWYSAESHRMMGDCMRQAGEVEKAETWFQKSLDISRHQKDRTLELRTTVSLARLRLEQNRREEARSLIDGIFNWFSEGFDSVDLQEASQLINQLS